MALYKQRKWSTSSNQSTISSEATRSKRKSRGVGISDLNTHFQFESVFPKTDENTFKSFVVKSTKAVKDNQQNAVKKRPKTTEVLNAPSQTPKTTITDNCIRSVLKRIRSSSDDADGFKTLEAFCKGDQRYLGDSGQHNDFSNFMNTISDCNV